MRCALTLIPLALFSASSFSQENPFEYAEEAPTVIEPVAVQQTQTIVQAEDLSRNQREEVLLLLAEALEKAAIAGGQGVYQIEGFKRFFVIDDEDLYLGSMNGEFVVHDTSRNQIEYVNSTGYMGVVTKTEWVSSIQGIVDDLTNVEAKTIESQAFEVEMPSVRPIEVGNKQSLDN
jgi:hypothetical protein